jgi:hypothetical protein
MNTGLASATVYTYRVQPYVVYNGKYYYGEVTSSLKGATRPVATKISLSAGKKYATVKWNKVNRASGYEIYMATPGGTYKHIATKGSSVKSYKKTKLTSKKYYYFVVRPYVLENGVRIYGSYSPAKYVKVK